MMARRISLTLLLGLLGLLGSATASLAQDYASDGAETCLGCHDYGADSSIAPLLDSSPHWRDGNPDNPRAQHGCESCHGPSAQHAQKPTQVAPAVSYGPRWNSGVEEQTASCQSCHGEAAGKRWHGSVHQQDNLTCNSCHEGHTGNDKVLTASNQNAVCLVCHKEQQDGIHQLSQQRDQNPPCSQCHDAHGNPEPKVTMLNNRSAGCVHCHNLVAMSKAPGANQKAASYHKTMSQRGRLCSDCHQKIAHVSAQGVAPVIARGVSSKAITLFSPGSADEDWLVSNHPGAQSLRQGRDCEQCHRGEEGDMGLKLATRGQAASRDMKVTFAVKGERLQVTLNWQGPTDDRNIAIMWGNDGNDAFLRGGCWASCHSDMPGMSQDRGQQQGKYLSIARAQQQRIGQPPRVKTTAQLAQLVGEGNYVEIWQAAISSATAATFSGGTVLEQVTWHEKSEVEGQIAYAKGRWTATFSRPLQGGPGNAKSFLPGKHYTFGIALNGAKLPAQAHWVSLPMTFSLDDRETDFIGRR